MTRRSSVRRFEDNPQELEMYVGTESRVGQRTVNIVAAEHEDSVLFPLDVSHVFASGVAFEDLSAPIGTELRAVQFDIPKQDIDICRQMGWFNDFNPELEILNMIKPIYGLKGAPRARRKKSHQVQTQRLSCRQLRAELELHVVREYEGFNCDWGSEPPPASGPSTIERAIAHVKEQTDETARDGKRR